MSDPRMLGVQIAQAALSEARGAGRPDYRAEALSAVRRARETWEAAQPDIIVAHSVAEDYILAMQDEEPRDRPRVMTDHGYAG